MKLNGLVNLGGNHNMIHFKRPKQLTNKDLVEKYMYSTYTYIFIVRYIGMEHLPKFVYVFSLDSSRVQASKDYGT